MDRMLKKLDFLIALGLLVFVSAMAFVWSYPYPHPDFWPVLSSLRYHVSLPLLGVLGHLGIGVFAGVLYILLRIAWLLGLDDEDELPDQFAFNQLAPLSGALLIALLPPVWRSAQFLSPGFLLLLIELCAVMVWATTRGLERLLTYTGAFLALGIVAGMHPFACAVLIFTEVLDSIARWQGGQFHGQKEDDEEVFETSQQELLFSASGGIVGFIIGAFVLARYVMLHEFTWNVPKIFYAWHSAWLAAFDHSMTSPFMLTVVGSVIAIIVAMAFGRRIRAVGMVGRPMARFMTTLVILCALVFVVRAHDGDARTQLSMIRTFVGDVVRDAGNAKWLFTDGRFDDVLRYECTKVGKGLMVMDVMNPVRKEDELQLKRMAPEPGDRALFVSGGAEVFRAWARERPDRLADSAWFIGGGILRQFGKTEQRTCGSVLRTKPEPDHEADFASANAQQEKFFADVTGFACRSSRWSRLFGGIDTRLREKFDALLWRLGRLASVRSDELAADGDLNGAQALRESVQRLNEANVTLRLQGSVLERMLPTANLVVTPREGLEIALKRADFVLAQRYAQEVLVSAPEDPSAHFAIGMINLEVKNYFEAVRQFEKVLKTRPNEPATLNNLSLAYLKLGKLDEARAAAEKALKANPDSVEIKKNLEAIQKAQPSSGKAG